MLRGVTAPRGHDHSPAAFRAALAAVPAAEQDGWVDRYLALGPPPDDGPELPNGCVPYLPCAVGVVLRAVELASVGTADVFVDVGAGVGRALAVATLSSGARGVGVEIQPKLVEAGRALGLDRVTFVEGDAALLPGAAREGTVFFLYCPFSNDRLTALLGVLEGIARTRPIRVCAVDLPLPACPWLELVAPAAGDLAVYRSR
jgi:SAM-dependent methyltransferase